MQAAISFLKALSSQVVLQGSACAVCGSKYDFNPFVTIVRCTVDRSPVCSRCGTDHAQISHEGVQILSAGRCCKAHTNTLNQFIDAEKRKISKRHAEEVIAAATADKNRRAAEYRLQELRIQAASVLMVSQNYKGIVPEPKLNKHIESEWHYDKNEAEIELKMLARDHGCTTIRDVSWDKDNDSGYRYVQSVWKCSGTI